MSRVSKQNPNQFVTYGDYEETLRQMQEMRKNMSQMKRQWFKDEKESSGGFGRAKTKTDEKLRALLNGSKQEEESEEEKRNKLEKQYQELLDNFKKQIDEKTEHMELLKYEQKRELKRLQQ